MTESETPIDRRAQHVAALGFILQLASFGTLLGISLWSDSHAIAAAARLMVIGLPIWAVLYLIFKQMRRVSAERIETAELKRAQQAGASTSIFELDDENLLLEQNRLRWMIRWMLPAVTVILALYLLLGHFVLWGWRPTLDQSLLEEGFRRTDQPELMMWFVVGMGFLCFLYARYAIALARLPDWQLLRAGAACKAGNAVVCLALVIALMASTASELAEPVVAFLIRFVLVLIGIEFTANLILDFYRPRTDAGIPRPSFDSRLLGLITEPGGIAKSIADAVDYQFGFAVSTTWFYQLLQRWMLPITVVTLVVILALTSAVIVDADEQVVVERFGRVVERSGRLAGGAPGVLGPGLYFKWPYPIDIVYRVPVQRVDELVIGEAAEEDDEDLRKPILWTEKHEYIPELMLLVASPPPQDEEQGRAPRSRNRSSSYDSGESVATSLVMISVPIEYRIKDIKKYLYSYQDPVKVMEGVTYRYLSDFAARVHVDNLLGPQREVFNQVIKQEIQAKLDELEGPQGKGVGIEIVFAGIRGAHPPARNKVAEVYQRVVAAMTNKEATINVAQKEQLKILTAVAGTRAQAEELDAVIQARDELRGDPDADPQALAAKERLVEELLMGNAAKGLSGAGGEAAALIVKARAEAAKQISDAAAKVRAFSAEVAAFETAPVLYQQRKRIAVYEELDNIRKYLITGDPKNVIIEYETREEGGLDRVLREKTE